MLLRLGCLGERDGNWAGSIWCDEDTTSGEATRDDVLLEQRGSLAGRHTAEDGQIWAEDHIGTGMLCVRVEHGPGPDVCQELDHAERVATC